MKKLIPFLPNEILFYSLLFAIIFLGNCTPKTAKETSTVSGGDSSSLPHSACVSIFANKMDILYIGVDNPVTIAIPGVDPSDYQVSIDGIGTTKIAPVSGDQYNVTVTSPTRAGTFVEIKVSGTGLNQTKQFRVKRIPDPIAILSRNKGGAIGNGEFKAQPGLSVTLEDFEFEANCKIQGFELTRIGKRQDPVSSVNRGARYNAKSERLVAAAKPGDNFIFTNIKAICPGDTAGRKINSIAFSIR